MAKPRGIRRFLRFSLRSLLLVTLAVAAWLGYEVHQARTVERQADAIRALGGEVEFRPSPWSLLRFIEPETYGRRIVAVQMPAESIDAALSQLASVSRLREVRVVFEGTSDQHAAWHRLNASVSQVSVSPVGPTLDEFDSVSDTRRVIMGYGGPKGLGRFRRFLEKVKQRDDVNEEVVEFLGRESREWIFYHDYRPIRLHNGSLAELFVGCDFYLVLLVDGKCMGTRFLGGNGQQALVDVVDVDGDGYVELGVLDSWEKNDSREWSALYAIEPSGFRSLLPVDRYARKAGSLNRDVPAQGDLER